MSSKSNWRAIPRQNPYDFIREFKQWIEFATEEAVRCVEIEKQIKAETWLMGCNSWYDLMIREKTKRQRSHVLGN